MKKSKTLRDSIGFALAKLLLLFVAGGALLRILLVFHPITKAGTLSLAQWAGMFGLGVVNDLCVGVLALLPLALFWLSAGHWRLGRPQCYVFLALLAVGWAYIAFFCPALWEFNKPLARILCWVMAWWIASFALRAFVPAVRKGWMRVWTAVLLFVYLGLMVMNWVSEWFFWNEFGVRYNFIAVDYLVYTSEVIGNIMQSYSMGWILTFVVAAGVGLELWLFRGVVRASGDYSQARLRVPVALGVGAVAVGAVMLLPVTARAQHSDNAWYNGLQANGLYSFAQAFADNELPYREFYLTVPEDEIPVAEEPESEVIVLADTGLAGYTPNIVMITMESMSADYMRRFGDERGLTPVLDSLWERSIAFERMFAAGNRTVRGLEALVLSRPPSPGESIIKRENNSGYPSIAEPLVELGYEPVFYYGGNSYFDNMESFFAGLGYKIRDRKTMDESDITSQTVWGVCDGDVYARVLADLDSAAVTGQPVLAHVLTTSNHRPYIYPEGCVSIPPSTQSRAGAVMYSDYALGDFLRRASDRDWFGNTVFVICADHCASSAGSTEIPLANYHIPALIYAPDRLRPRAVEETVSQIDLMPTLFAQLGLEPAPGLYGRNVFDFDYEPRAFVATYQDLGYLKGDTLTVLSPGRNVRQFVLAPTADDPYATRPADTLLQALIHEAAALYQSADAK